MRSRTFAERSASSGVALRSRSAASKTSPRRPAGAGRVGVFWGGVPRNVSHIAVLESSDVFRSPNSHEPAGPGVRRAEIVYSFHIARRHGGRRLPIWEIVILNPTLLLRMAIRYRCTNSALARAPFSTKVLRPMRLSSVVQHWPKRFASFFSPSSSVMFPPSRIACTARLSIAREW